MVAGKLPWEEIQKEVVLAVQNYMMDEHGSMKSTITLHFLVDYIYYRNDIVLYPHLAGITKDMLDVRCEKAIRLMGWEKYARRVFIVPYGPGGNIRSCSQVGVEA